MALTSREALVQSVGPFVVMILGPTNERRLSNTVDILVENPSLEVAEVDRISPPCSWWRLMGQSCVGIEEDYATWHMGSEKGSPFSCLEAHKFPGKSANIFAFRTPLQLVLAIRVSEAQVILNFQVGGFQSQDSQFPNQSQGFR